MQATIKNEPTILLAMTVTQAQILTDFAAELTTNEINDACERIFIGFSPIEREQRAAMVSETLDAVSNALQPAVRKCTA